MFTHYLRRVIDWFLRRGELTIVTLNDDYGHHEVHHRNHGTQANHPGHLRSHVHHEGRVAYVNFGGHHDEHDTQHSPIQDSKLADTGTDGK